MAAVIAAIVAAALAGAIALYRERRIELRALLVGARVVSSALLEASLSLDVTADRPGLTGHHAIELVDSFQGEKALVESWEAHRAILAAHLPLEHWRRIVIALRHFRLIGALEKADKDTILRVSHDLTAGSTLLYQYASRAGWFRNPGRSSKVRLPPYSGEFSDTEIEALWRERKRGFTEGKAHND